MSKLKSRFEIIRQVLTGKYPLGQFMYYCYLWRKDNCIFKKLIYNIDIRKLPSAENFHIINLDNASYMKQFNHPDVVAGRYLGKECLLLSMTSYPFNDDRFENPHLFVSYNGIDFLSKGKNPIAAYDNHIEKSHLSDSEISLVGDKICVFYRNCIITENTRFEQIEMKLTADCLHWTEEKIVLTGEYKRLLSPSIVKCDKNYRLFSVNAVEENRYVEFRNSDNGIDFSLDSYGKAKIVGMPVNTQIWHLDVIKETYDVWHGLFVLNSGEGGKDARLFYAHSNDEGNTWVVGKEIKVCENQEKYFRKIYRSSMVLWEGKYVLYVSVMTTRNSWYTYRLNNFCPQDYMA